MPWGQVAANKFKKFKLDRAYKKNTNRSRKKSRASKIGKKAWDFGFGIYHKSVLGKVIWPVFSVAMWKAEVILIFQGSCLQSFCLQHTKAVVTVIISRLHRDLRKKCFLHRFQRGKLEFLLWKKVKVISSDNEKLSIPLFLVSLKRCLCSVMSINFC